MYDQDIYMIYYLYQQFLNHCLTRRVRFVLDSGDSSGIAWNSSHAYSTIGAHRSPLREHVTIIPQPNVCFTRHRSQTGLVIARLSLRVGAGSSDREGRDTVPHRTRPLRCSFGAQQQVLHNLL